MEKLINHIKENRARLGLTQEALAAAVGVTRQTIISIESGKYVPSALLALKVARALGKTVEAIFEIQVESAPEPQKHVPVRGRILD